MDTVWKMRRMSLFPGIHSSCTEHKPWYESGKGRDSEDGSNIIQAKVVVECSEVTRDDNRQVITTYDAGHIWIEQGDAHGIGGVPMPQLSI